MGRFRSFSIYLSSYQASLTDAQQPPCQTPGMDLSKMTRQEIEALLWLLAEFEWEEMELLMRERREVERKGQLR